MNYKRKPTDSKRGSKRVLDQPYKPKVRQMPTLLGIPLADGEDEASHDRHIKMLKSECKKVNPSKMVCGELMKRTFTFRCQMVMENTYSVDYLLSLYPALRFPGEVFLTSFMYIMR